MSAYLSKEKNTRKFVILFLFYLQVVVTKKSRIFNSFFVDIFCEKKICICRLNIQIETINLELEFLSNSTCDKKSNTIINLQISVLSADNISHARLCLPTQNRRKRNEKKKVSFVIWSVDIFFFYLWLGFHTKMLVQSKTILFINIFVVSISWLR